LSAYHYGAATSTASQYGGVLDIRGEVILLTRNVKIVGDNTEAWGCQIVTSDFVEFKGPRRYGSTILDNVEIFNCSQYDTQKAAVRFDGASGSYSQISNSTIHHGLGWGVNIESSANIKISKTAIFSFL
jgi:hypothetical protein